MAYDAMRFSREFLIGVNEENKSQAELKLYPNPAKDIFKITVPFVTEENRELTISSVNGVTIKTLNIPFGIDEYSISAKSLQLSSGNYFIQLKSRDKTLTQKLSIIRWKIFFLLL